MRRSYVLASAAILAAAVGSSASAQDTLGSATPSGVDEVQPLTSTCDHLFGSGNLVWCVSSNGNVTRLISPAGNQILPAGASNNEGYELCHGGVERVSLGWREAGWGPASLVSKTTTSIQISRTSTDGQFTLLQKISRDTNERDLTIQMKLTNNGAAKTGVMLGRFAEVGVDGDAGDDRYDATVDSLWAREFHGFTASPRLGIAHSIWIGDMNRITCAALSPQAVPGGPGSAYFSNRFDIGNMNAGQSKTMYLVYRAQ